MSVYSAEQIDRELQKRRRRRGRFVDMDGRCCKACLSSSTHVGMRIFFNRWIYFLHSLFRGSETEAAGEEEEEKPVKNLNEFK